MSLRRTLVPVLLLLSLAYRSGQSEDCQGFKGDQRLVAGTTPQQVSAGMDKAYRGCTRILNNLLITNLEFSINDTSYFNDIQEVVGTVFIFNNSAHQIVLPNLAVIRGQHQLAAHRQRKLFSFVIQDNGNLSRLTLPKLHSIQQGEVFGENNPKWCWESTIPWNDLTRSSVKFSQTGMSCSSNVSCHPNCKNGCWGPSVNDCYTETLKPCAGLNCPYRCSNISSSAQLRCCARECEAGCTGTRDTNCVVCRSKRNGDRCVSSCPPLTQLNYQTLSFEVNPDGRYDNGLDCVKSCKSKDKERFALGQKCVDFCPRGYSPDSSNVCQYCGDQCVIHCPGTNKASSSIPALAGILTLELLEETYNESCTIIDGDLMIDGPSFYHPSTSSPDGNISDFSQLDALRSVRHITGCLRILNFEYSNLTFLENLETVGNCSLKYPPPYSNGGLEVKDSPDLQFLGLASLKSVAGTILFYKNENLCYVNSFSGWKENISQAHGFNTFGTSGAASTNSCVAEGMDNCDRQCGNGGCIGPRPNDCQSCAIAGYLGYCLANCSLALRFTNGMPVYHDEGKRQCLECHEQCVTCTGPSNHNCTKCKNYLLGTACVDQCPDGTFISGKTCKACNPACTVDQGLLCSGGGTHLGQGGCTSCSKGEFKSDGTFVSCVSICPVGTYDTKRVTQVGPAKRIEMCSPCHDECADGCTDPTPRGCTRCARYSRVSGSTTTCIQSCLPNEYADSSKQCHLCHSQCDGGCHGAGATACTRCKNMNFSSFPGEHECLSNCNSENLYKLQGTKHCVTACPSKRYPYTLEGQIKECRLCNEECEENCTGPGSAEEVCRGACLNFVENGKCVPRCSGDYASNEGEKTCTKSGEKQPEEVSGGTSSSTGGIIGGTVAGVTLVVVVILLVLYYSRRYYHSKPPPSATMELPGQDNPNYGVSMDMIMDADTLKSGPALAEPNLAQLVLVQEDHIETGAVLGAGAFGTVYEGVWLSDEDGEKIRVPVAVKVLKENTGAASNAEILQEAVTMASVDHPHLVRLLCLCMGQRIMLLTELMPLGSLLSYLKNRKTTLTGTNLLTYSHQISMGMQYLEERRMVHRDLAARNVLVASPTCVKITDFGLARLLDVGSEKFDHDGGKMPVKWLAPECMSERIFTHQTDVWAFGVTVWEVLTFGNAPYKVYRGAQIYSVLKRGERLPQPRIASGDLDALLRKCWEWEANSRPTFSDMGIFFADALKNPGLYVRTKADIAGRLCASDQDFAVVAPELAIMDDDGYEHFDPRLSARYDNPVQIQQTSRDSLSGNLVAEVAYDNMVPVPPLVVHMTVEEEEGGKMNIKADPNDQGGELPTSNYLIPQDQDDDASSGDMNPASSTDKLLADSAVYENAPAPVIRVIKEEREPGPSFENPEYQANILVDAS